MRDFFFVAAAPVMDNLFAAKGTTEVDKTIFRHQSLHHAHTTQRMMTWTQNEHLILVEGLVSAVQARIYLLVHVQRQQEILCGLNF